MTNTEKQLIESVKKALYEESHKYSTAQERNLIELFHQAVAEERERVVDIIESMYQRRKMQLPSHSVINIRGADLMCKIERYQDAKSIHIEQYSRTDGYNQALGDLLTYLQDITNKDI